MKSERPQRSSDHSLTIGLGQRLVVALVISLIGSIGAFTQANAGALMPFFDVPVVPAPTVSATPVGYGAPETISDTLTAGTGSPACTGTSTDTLVYFDVFDSGHSQATPNYTLTATPSGTTWTYSTQGLLPATYSVVADAEPFGTSGDCTRTLSTATSLVVNKSTPLITVTPSLTSTQYGESDSIVVKADGPTGSTAETPSTPLGLAPTGTVSLNDPAPTSGLLTAPNNEESSVTLNVNDLKVGTDTVTGTYPIGDGNYGPATGNATVTVSAGPLVVAAPSYAGSSTYGEQTSVSTTVTNFYGETDLTAPTGSLEFTDGSFNSGFIDPTSTAGSITTFTYTIPTGKSLPVGNTSLTATWQATGTTNDLNYSCASPSTCTSNTSFTIGAGTATLNPITGTTTPITYGTSESMTATVSDGTGTPTGTVTFYANTLSGLVQLSSCGVTTNLTSSSAGSASALCTIDDIPGGTTSVYYTYNGDGNYNSGPAAATALTVNQQTDTTSVSPSTASSVFSQSVTYTVTVTPAVPATSPLVGPTGSAYVCANAGSCPTPTSPGYQCTATVTGGTGICSSTATPLGTNTITAEYLGDSNYVASTSGASSEDVSAASVTVGLTVSSVASGACLSAVQSCYGQTVTLTATVAEVFPATAQPTGDVAFFGPDGLIGSAVALSSSGVAQISLTTLPVGTNSLQAIYNTIAGGGTVNSDWNLNSSAPTPWTVVQDGSQTVPTGPGSVTYGAPLDITATVEPLAPGGTAPSCYPGETGGLCDAGSVTVAFTSPQGTISCTNGNPVNSDLVDVTVTSPPSQNGQAICDTNGTDLTVGSDTVSAQFSGDTQYTGSLSVTPLAVSVGQQSTTTTLAVSPASPQPYGTAVTLTATVTGGTFQPATGGAGDTVTFYDGVVSIGSVALVASGGNSDTATLVTNSPNDYELAGGTHSFTATFAGDTNSATSSTLAATSYTISPANSTTVTLMPLASTIAYGGSVTFTATVTYPLGAAAPTGSVTFTDSLAPAAVCGGTPVAVVNNAGTVTATCTTAAYDLVGGSNSVTAVYSGDTNYTVSAVSPTPSVITVTTIAPTITQVVATPGVTASFGQSVTLSVTVTGSGANPTGTVTFCDNATAPPCVGGTTLGSPAVNGVTGVATFVTTTLAVGSHSFTATYNGNTNYSSLTSTPTTPYTITTDASGTALTASNATPTYGDADTFTATVTNKATGINPASPDTVTFTDTIGVTPVTLHCNGTASDVVVLGNNSNPTNVATCLTDQYDLQAGNNASASNLIEALFSGDTNNAISSDAIAYTVAPAPTTTAVTSPGTGASFYGQPQTFIATVTNSLTGPQNPASPGTVTFSNSLGTISCNSGSSTVTLDNSGTSNAAQCVTAAGDLTVGTDQITATFNGGPDFAASAKSPNYTQTVTAASTSVAVTGAPATTPYGGGAVTLTVTVTDSTAGSTGNPAGTVALSDNDATNVPAPVTLDCNASSTNQATLSPSGASAATATCAVTAFNLPGGTNDITAVFTPSNANFIGAASPALPYMVSTVPSSTVVTSSGTPSTYGQAVTFTATVTGIAGGAAPTQSVQFADNQNGAGVAITCNGGSNTVSTFTTASDVSTYLCVTAAYDLPGGGSAPPAMNPPGPNDITATYSGDNNYQSSLNAPAFAQSVNPEAITSIAVTSLPATSTYGQSVTFTATLTFPAGGVAPQTGDSVTFTDVVSGNPVTISCNSEALTNTGVNVYTATCITAATALIGGTDLVTAIYTGDSNYLPASGTDSQVVSPASDAVSTPTSSVNPSVYGAPITFTTTVTGVAGGLAPTGTVTFNGTDCNVTPSTFVSSTGNASTYSCTTDDMAPPGALVSATYNGDTNYVATTSGTLNQGVTAAPSSTSVNITSGTNPSTYGQQVTFTATITGVVAHPTGTVTFTDAQAAGAVTISCTGLQGGSNVAALLPAGAHTSTATCTTYNYDLPGGSTAVNPPGPDEITATYSGDGNYSASSNATAFAQTVNPEAITSMTLAGAPSPSVYGDPVTFTATLTFPTVPVGSAPPQAGDSVTFTDILSGVPVVISCNAKPLINTAPDVYTATCTTAALALLGGSHSVTASYTGDSNYNADAAIATQQVNPGPDSISTPTSSLNPADYGQEITFTTTVTGIAGGVTPTGTVTFNNTNHQCDASASAEVSSTSDSATYSCSTETMDVTGASVTATYNGDTNYAPATSGTLSQVVATEHTTTSVTSSATSSPFDRVGLQYTATVTPVDASETQAPQGTVTFTAQWTGTVADPAVQGGQPITLCSALPVRGSLSVAATCVVSQAELDTLDVGSPAVHYTVSATFAPSGPGAGDFGASSGTIAQSLTPIAAIATITCDSACTGGVVGQTVGFTAAVSNSSAGNPYHTPSGSVTFEINGRAITCDGQSGTSVSFSSAGNGAIPCRTSDLPAGNPSISVVYDGGDAFNDYAAGAAAATTLVGGVGLGTPGTFTPISSLNPSSYTQNVTLTVTIDSNTGAGLIPTGNVTFLSDGVAIGTATLNSNGTASITVNSLAVGGDAITARYSGGANYSPASSGLLTQTVNQAAPQVGTVTVSNSNPGYGQSVTITVTVGGGATGTITFYDNGNPLATATVSNGVASITMSGLGAGSHAITATYSGDPNHKSGSAGQATLTVTKASTTTGATASATTVASGGSVTISINVTASNGTNPTGTVTIYDNGSQLRTATLNGSGDATVSIPASALNPGGNKLTVTYGGDANDTGSSSASVSVAGPGSFPWWLVIVIIIIGLLLLFFFLAKRRRPGD